MGPSRSLGCQPRELTCGGPDGAHETSGLRICHYCSPQYSQPHRGPPEGFAAPALSSICRTRRGCLSTWRGCMRSAHPRPCLTHRRTKAPKEKGLFRSPKATPCPHLSGLPPPETATSFRRHPPPAPRKRCSEPERPPVGGHRHGSPTHRLPPPTHPAPPATWSEGPVVQWPGRQ